MDAKTNCELIDDFQSWIKDLCIAAKYLPSMVVRDQLDSIDALATLLDVRVEIPDLPGWRAVALEEPPQLTERRI